MEINITDPQFAKDAFTRRWGNQLKTKVKDVDDKIAFPNIEKLDVKAYLESVAEIEDDEMLKPHLLVMGSLGQVDPVHFKRVEDLTAEERAESQIYAQRMENRRRAIEQRANFFEIERN